MPLATNKGQQSNHREEAPMSNKATAAKPSIYQTVSIASLM